MKVFGLFVNEKGVQLIKLAFVRFVTYIYVTMKFQIRDVSTWKKPRKNKK